MVLIALNKLPSCLLPARYKNVQIAENASWKNAVTNGAKNTASFGKNGVIARTNDIKTVSNPHVAADITPLITPIL